jgi:hypothetical protein
MSLRAAVQEVMNKSRSPLVELYSVTHLFCLSLQLDILKNQADSLNKLKNSFNITNLSYERDTLTLHYWKYVQACRHAYRPKLNFLCTQGSAE